MIQTTHCDIAFRSKFIQHCKKFLEFACNLIDSLREGTSPSMKATRKKRRKHTAYHAHDTEHDERRLLIMLIMMSRLSRDMLSTLITLSTLSITILTQIFYVYITKIVPLDRSFVLNSCNSQYNQFYCLSYLQTLVYRSKKFVTLVYLCLYLVLFTFRCLPCRV